MEGIQPAVKAALTKAYNKGSSSRVIRTADLITVPGIKKAPKKRVAAMLEPVEETLVEDNGNAVGKNDEENGSESEESGIIFSSFLLSPTSFPLQHFLFPSLRNQKDENNEKCRIIKCVPAYLIMKSLL